MRSTWENWDGLNVATNMSTDGKFGPNDLGWTPQQFERNANNMAWMARPTPGAALPVLCRC